MNGCILYRGPSRIDGRKIVVVATGLSIRSDNPKTGPMIQTYILTDGNLDPVQSRARGRDQSVCGDCPHSAARTCYVNLAQAPLQIWRSLHEGAYPHYRPSFAPLFRGRPLRIGAYGDPAAAPVSLWRRLTRLASSHTGYTHQWRQRYAQPLRKYCMASCDSAADLAAARALGWRTFRVRSPGEPLLPGEFSCPASAEQRHRLTCAECRACDGATQSPRAASPSILFHGPAITGNWRLKRFQAVQAGQRFPLPTVP